MQFITHEEWGDCAEWKQDVHIFWIVQFKSKSLWGYFSGRVILKQIFEKWVVCVYIYIYVCVCELDLTGWDRAERQVCIGRGGNASLYSMNIGDFLLMQSTLVSTKVSEHGGSKWYMTLAAGVLGPTLGVRKKKTNFQNPTTGMECLKWLVSLVWYILARSSQAFGQPWELHRWEQHTLSFWNRLQCSLVYVHMVLYIFTGWPYKDSPQFWHPSAGGWRTLGTESRGCCCA